MKKTITLALTLITLLVMGCQGGDTGIKKLDPHKGIEGLTLQFLKGSPPPSILAPEQGHTTSFPVTLQLANKGAWPVHDASVVMGLEKEYMNFVQWQVDETARERVQPLGAGGERIQVSLDGKNELYPLGEEETITGLVNALPIEEQTEQNPTTAIRATACYKYKTEATAEVCVDTDVHNLKPTDKVCQVQDITLTDQGSPVAVTKIVPTILPVQEGFVTPQFIIHVENKGKGEIVRQDKVQEACTSQALGKDDWNIVNVEEVSLSGMSVSNGLIACDPFFIPLRQGKGFTRCTMKEGVVTTENPAYTTPLYVRLGYGYSSSVSTRVVMEKLLTY
jgi:hypothetical protein